jgi:hypothetical protein
MKTLSVECQNAYLICLGIKDVENRSWRTKHRGRLLIHSSGSYCDEIDISFFPKNWQEEFEKKKDIRYVQALDSFYEGLYRYYGTKDYTKWKEKEYYMKAQAIIGSVDLVDIVENSTSEWSMEGQYHWVLENAELFDVPIMFVKGKLKLWDYNIRRA